jgi:secreted Zn-dependent insulinase-like peptidase
MLKNYTNTIYGEPYSRLDALLVGALTGDNPDSMKQMKILNDMTYEKFEDLRKQWLQNAAFQWLIQGQLSTEKAITIQNKAV